MSELTYLITGANRGIGKAILSILLLRPNVTVIAAVRDPIAASKTLRALPAGQGSQLILIKIDVTSKTDAAAAVESLKSTHGISKIDILISNAGFMGPIAPVLETEISSVEQHMEINVLGPLRLFQAFHPLLSASSNARFFLLSSSIGSINELENLRVPFFAYGISKCAANYLLRKMQFENEWLTTVAFNPGWVQTEMGDGAAKEVGMKAAPLTVEESVTGLVKGFDGATKDVSGSFIGIDGKVVPW